MDQPGKVANPGCGQLKSENDVISSTYQNTPRHSGHNKTFRWDQTLGQQYNVGEKPTVVLYTYINHHAQLPVITQHTD